VVPGRFFRLGLILLARLRGVLLLRALSQKRRRSPIPLPIAYLAVRPVAAREIRPPLRRSPGFGVTARLAGLPRAFRAWPLAWPSPVRPAGWQRSPGSTARRRRVPRSGMRRTLRLEGPARIMRGVPARRAATSSQAPDAPGARVTAWPWRWRARQRDTAGNAGGRSPGVPCAAVAAP